VGLCLWAGGLLGARSTAKAVFDDLGVKSDAEETMQRQIALAVGLMIPICFLGICASVWLEGLGDIAPGQLSSLLSGSFLFLQLELASQMGKSTLSALPSTPDVPTKHTVSITCYLT
jgi:hypothetical protein